VRYSGRENDSVRERDKTVRNLANSKIFCSISASFEFQKFLSHKMKAMAKDKKVNIAVT